MTYTYVQIVQWLLCLPIDSDPVAAEWLNNDMRHFYSIMRTTCERPTPDMLLFRLWQQVFEQLDIDYQLCLQDSGPFYSRMLRDYKDTAKARRLRSSAGSKAQVRATLSRNLNQREADIPIFYTLFYSG